MPSDLPPSSCPHCGAPVLPRSEGDVESRLWQFDCGTIDSDRVEKPSCVARGTRCYERQIDGLKAQLALYSNG